MSFEIWAEKYRPKMLDEVIGQRHIIKRLKGFVEKKNIPHMLFAGPAGCGKTTTALCMAHELYGTGWKRNYLELNASDERGINVIRMKVKDFARTRPIGANFKVICLDEADALTQEAQQALRRTMENYTSSCRFILSCNYSSHIIEPIQSRCAVFRFRSHTKEDVVEYLKRIATAEKLNVDGSGYDAILELSGGDLRKVSNLLQTASMEEKIDEKTIYDVAAQAAPADVKKMMEEALAKNFLESRKSLQDLLFKQGISGEDIIREISKQVYNLQLSDKEKIELIEKVGECEFRLDQGANEQIQLEALLAKFAMFGKG
ncbi:MAG: replication factor C small subunit [Candidatus Aenigmatarchaeota archaeon]